MLHLLVEYKETFLNGKVIDLNSLSQIIDYLLNSSEYLSKEELDIVNKINEKLIKNNKYE